MGTEERAIIAGVVRPSTENHFSFFANAATAAKDHIASGKRSSLLLLRLFRYRLRDLPRQIKSPLTTAVSVATAAAILDDVGGNLTKVDAA